MPIRFLAAFILCALCAAHVARADDPAMRAAKRHFDRGEKLYALAKFSEALDEYQKAFDAKPIPDFLFNIGQCYRNLGDYDSAIFSYKKYLKLAPDASNRDKVEALIEDLEQKKDQGNTQRLGLATKKHTDDNPEHPPDQPIYTKWWFWAGVAVVGTAGGIGIYEATKSGGAPDTNLGNIVFGK
jgi:tetratricopeptide (TPR) repeat protein